MKNSKAHARLLQALVTPAQHYKLYKSGRHWLLMGLTTFVFGCVSVTTQVAAADTASVTTEQETTLATPATVAVPETATTAGTDTIIEDTPQTDNPAPVTESPAPEADTVVGTDATTENTIQADTPTSVTDNITPNAATPAASTPVSPATTSENTTDSATPATTTVETTYHFIPVTGSLNSLNVLTDAYTNANGYRYTVIDRTVTNTIDENGTWTNITDLSDDHSTQVFNLPVIDGYNFSEQIAVNGYSMNLGTNEDHYAYDGHIYSKDNAYEVSPRELSRVDGQNSETLAHTLANLYTWNWSLNSDTTETQRAATEFWFYVYYRPNEATLLLNYTDSETGEVLKTYNVPTFVGESVATDLYSPPADYYVVNARPFVQMANNGLTEQVVNIPVTKNSQTITRTYTDSAGNEIFPTETSTGAPFTTLNLAGDTYLQDYPNSPYHLNIAASSISFTSNELVGIVAQPAESYSYDHLSDHLAFANDGTISFPGITDTVTANQVDIPFGPDGITIPLSLFSPERIASATPTTQDQAALRLEIASATNEYQALLTKWLTSDEAGFTAEDQSFVTAKTTAFTNNANQLDWSNADAITLFLWDAYNWLFAMNTYNNITVNYVYDVDPIGEPTADPQTRTQVGPDLTVTPNHYYDNRTPSTPADTTGTAVPSTATDTPAQATTTPKVATTTPAVAKAVDMTTPTNTMVTPTKAATATETTTLPQTDSADDTVLLVVGGLTILGSIGLLGASEICKRRDGFYDL